MSLIISPNVTSFSKLGDTLLSGDVTISGGTGILLTEASQDIQIELSAIAIGTTVTSGTAGSILFVTAFGLSQNNTKLFWDNVNFREGIGTNSSLTAKVNIVIGSATEIGLNIKAAASQSANTFDIYDSSGNTNTSFDFSGKLKLNLTARSISANETLISCGSSIITVSSAISVAGISFAQTYLYTVSQTAFAGNILYSNSTIYKNSPSLTGSIGNVTLSFNNIPIYTADTNVTTMGLLALGYRDNPTFNTVNGGTLTSALWFSFVSTPSVNAGATITDRRGLYIADCLGTTTNTAIHIDNLVSGGTNYGIRSGIASNAASWFLYHSGTAVSNHTGMFKIGDVTQPTAMLDVLNTTGANPVLRIRGAASQSGNYFRAADSANATIANITSTGSVNFAVPVAAVATLGSTSSTAVHQINGGLNVTTRTITNNLTIDTTTSDYIILCNFSSGKTVTLPAPTNGRLIIIKDISGTANTNNITLARNGSETIDGIAASKIFQTDWGEWVITSDGTNWMSS